MAGENARIAVSAGGVLGTRGIEIVRAIPEVAPIEITYLCGADLCFNAGLTTENTGTLARGAVVIRSTRFARFPRTVATTLTIGSTGRSCLYRARARTICH